MSLAKSRSAESTEQEAVAVNSGHIAQGGRGPCDNRPSVCRTEAIKGLGGCGMHHLRTFGLVHPDGPVGWLAATFHDPSAATTDLAGAK